MSDFVFGTLATDELRLANLRARRAGVTHFQARQPRDPLPGEAITLHLSVGPAHPYESAWVYWTVDGSEPQGERGHPVHGNATRMEPAWVEWDTYLWGYIRHFQATLPGQAEGSVLRYRIGAASVEVETLADQGATYACYIANDPPPAWTQQAVIYQVFVDRFFPGAGKRWQAPVTPAGFYGGTLRGVTQKLEHVAALGANVLWLTPIFPSPSHHGYDATDLFDVEPRLGSKADLRELINAAHAQGMRILLDFVPNHWSNLHPTFQDAIRNPESPYREWYTFTSYPDQYESFFGVPELPQVNLRNPAARAKMLEAVAYWLEFGADGYRVDYALGPTPDFWADFRKVMRTTNPEAWAFGEVVEPPDAQLNFAGGLDGCLDFNLMEGLRQAFAYGNWDAERLSGFLARHDAYFPASVSRPSFLDNHDMNRFLWAAGGDKRKLQLAALCQFTLRGAPVIYYGTEVGLTQERDVRQGGLGLPEESRLPMLWGETQDAGLLGFYQSLVKMRLEHPSISTGRFQLMLAVGDTLAYLCGDAPHNLLVVINLSKRARSALLPGNWPRVIVAAGDKAQVISGDGTAWVDLPAMSGIILAPE